MTAAAKAEHPVPASCDVLVIGGGPAGSTAATLLRRRGWRVVLCDKDRHPRFHIGESLLPMNVPLFERLGILEQVSAIGVRKHGVDLISPTHAARARTTFFDDVLAENNYAFHVRRAEFDHLLLRHCASEGTEVHEETTVREVDLGAGMLRRVRAVDGAGVERLWDARFVIDASGRDTFLARRLGLKRRNRKHQSAAIFGHFSGVARQAGRSEGNISLFWFPHGWFWMIPLPGDAFSVGAVCWPDYLKTRRTDLETFLWDTIALCPGVAERMRGAALLGAAHGTGNYTYSATRMYGDGYVLIGDAYAFVDPVFSSGVYLAMHSAALGAEAVDAALKGTPEAARLMRAFDRRTRRGLRLFSWFIYRFTAPAMHDLFMAPRNILGMRDAVVSIFAGDVFGRSPHAPRILLFKGVYYLTAALNLLGSLAAYRVRRRNASLSFTEGDPA